MTLITVIGFNFKVKSQKLRGKFNRKVPNQMEKSYDKTCQTNGQQLSCSYLGTGIFKCKKWWIEPGFIALNLSLVRQSQQFRLYLQ